MTADVSPDPEFVENIPDLPDKVLSVIKLKLAGASDAEICQVLGIADTDTVEKMVERALRKEMMRSTSSREYARVLLKKKLDALYQTAASKAFNPNHPEHLAAGGHCARLLAQEAKLLGLDAPTEVTVNTPTRAELEAFIANASGIASLPEEANILDVEVIEDDEPPAIEA